MSVTATEFKMNFGKYLLMAATEDVFITRNGKLLQKSLPPLMKTSLIPSTHSSKAFQTL